MKKLSLTLLTAALTFSFSSMLQANALPLPSRTPGAINLLVSQDNIQETICKSGWTKTVRPSAGYTNRLKRRQINEWGLVDKDLSHYEEDHLVSIELGGALSDPRNLWPQLYGGLCGARKKDVIETRLKILVCNGKLGLREAQKAIADNWVLAYRKYVGPISCIPK